WLAEHGFTLDVDMTQVLQGVSSGRSADVSYDGLANYELNSDTGKMGLWPVSRHGLVASLARTGQPARRRRTATLPGSSRCTAAQIGSLRAKVFSRGEIKWLFKQSAES